MTISITQVTKWIHDEDSLEILKELRKYIDDTIKRLEEDEIKRR